MDSSAIGHHLTKYLINRGYWVRGVDIKEPEYEPTCAHEFELLPQGVRGRNSHNTRLREILKWEPQVSLEDGLARTYEWIEGELKKKPISAAVTAG